MGQEGEGEVGDEREGSKDGRERWREVGMGGGRIKTGNSFEEEI